MTACWLLLHALLALAPPAAGSETKAPALAGATQPPAVQESLRLLAQGSSAERDRAAGELLALGQESVVPALLAALSTADPRLQVRIVTGLVGRFPQRALSDLMGLLEAGDRRQREAALRGFSLLDDERTLPPLLRALSGPDEELRRAALYSLMSQLKPLMEAAKRRVAGDGPPLPAHLHDRLHALDAAALAHFSQEPPPAESRELLLLLSRVADESLARAAVARFRRQRPAGEEALGKLIARLQAANRRWLGRPVVPKDLDLGLRVSLRNVLVDRSEEHAARFGAGEHRGLRLRGHELLRGNSIVLPLDLLVLFPSDCAPVLELAPGPASEGQLAIRYRIHEAARLRADIGWLSGASYLAVTARDAQESLLLVDAKRGVPLEETFFDGAGKRLGTVRYSSYLELAPGEWAPQDLRLELERTDQGLPVAFDLRFGAAPGGLWLLQEAQAGSLERGAPALRAVLRFLDVQRLGAGGDGAPAGEPAGRAPGD